MPHAVFLALAGFILAGSGLDWGVWGLRLATTRRLHGRDRLADS